MGSDAGGSGSAETPVESSKAPGKLQIRYGEEDGSGAPLLIFHPLAACLFAGMAAGLLAFAFGELVHDSFEAAAVNRELEGVKSDRPTPEAQDAATVKNAALADAGLGALLGLFLGLAGGMLREDARRGAVGGGVGLVLGGVAGAALALGVLPAALRFRNDTAIDHLIVGTATQLVFWGLIAATAGAAFGVAFGGVKTIPRFAAQAIGGALLGVLLYAAVGAAAFPLAETDRPLAAEAAPRLLARLAVALGAGAAVGLSLTGRHRRSQRWAWQQPRPAEFPGPEG